MVLFFFTVPVPLHVEHFFSKLVPEPLQSGQVVLVKKLPNIVLCSEVTVPEPLHVEQVLGLKPPFPSHSGQVSTISNFKSFLHP